MQCHNYAYITLKHVSNNHRKPTKKTNFAQVVACNENKCYLWIMSIARRALSIWKAFSARYFHGHHLESCSFLQLHLLTGAYVSTWVYYPLVHMHIQLFIFYPQVAPKYSHAKWCLALIPRLWEQLCQSNMQWICGNIVWHWITHAYWHCVNKPSDLANHILVFGRTHCIWSYHVRIVWSTVCGIDSCHISTLPHHNS